MKISRNIALLLLLLVSPAVVYSECVQYQIIDHGDHVEAICIGEPLTDQEKVKQQQESARRDQETAAAWQNQKMVAENEEVQRKLSKVNCTGQPGECGPGRVCMMFYGLCKEKAEANNIINSVRGGLQETQRNFNETQKNTELNRRLDNIDRTLRDNKNTYELNRTLDNLDKNKRNLYR